MELNEIGHEIEASFQVWERTFKRLDVQWEMAMQLAADQMGQIPQDGNFGQNVVRFF